MQTKLLHPKERIHQGQGACHRPTRMDAFQSPMVLHPQTASRITLPRNWMTGAPFSSVCACIKGFRVTMARTIAKNAGKINGQYRSIDERTFMGECASQIWFRQFRFPILPDLDVSMALHTTLASLTSKCLLNEKSLDWLAIKALLLLLQLNSIYA